MCSDKPSDNAQHRSSVNPRPFNGCTVSFSHLSDSEDKKQLRKQIKQLGGKYSPSLCYSTVTHLVTQDWTSDKSFVARRYKKPIVMTPKWIESVAKQSESEILPAIHPSFLIHRLPIFYGFTLCFSQINFADRDKAKQKVERNGGKYVGNFDPAVVTHLVLVAPEGAKYEKSLKYDSIKKVSALWVSDSLKYGVPLPEQDYPVVYMDQATNNTFNQVTCKRKSGDSFPNMSEFLASKKTKSNLFDVSIPRDTKKLNLSIRDSSINKSIHNTSQFKADEFESILKDLGNIKANNRRVINSPIDTSRSEKKTEKLKVKKVDSSQLSDKITVSLPILWEGST